MAAADATTAFPPLGAMLCALARWQPPKCRFCPRGYLHSHSSVRNLSRVTAPQEIRQRACERLVGVSSWSRRRNEPTTVACYLGSLRAARAKHSRYTWRQAAGLQYGVEGESLSWCAGRLGWQCSSRHSRHFCFVRLHGASRPAQVGRLIAS